jgi:hypothetical protein
MKLLVSSSALLALLSVATCLPAELPAGVDAAACPNYPFCGASAPADLPTPVVNGQSVAPVLNTLPDQTAAFQQVLTLLTYWCRIVLTN